MFEVCMLLLVVTSSMYCGIYFQPVLKKKQFCCEGVLLCTRGVTVGCVVSPPSFPAFVPAPPVAPVPSPAPMPPVHPPPPMEDEPVSKKLKSEDSLIPEEEFLRRNKVHVWVTCAGLLHSSSRGAVKPIPCTEGQKYRAKKGLAEVSSFVIPEQTKFLCLLLGRVTRSGIVIFCN